jgi:hypothetical protein
MGKPGNLRRAPMQARASTVEKRNRQIFLVAYQNSHRVTSITSTGGVQPLAIMSRNDDI